jgi:hypothetical protein
VNAPIFVMTLDTPFTTPVTVFVAFAVTVTVACLYAPFIAAIANMEVPFEMIDTT